MRTSSIEPLNGVLPVPLIPILKGSAEFPPENVPVSLELTLVEAPSI